MQTIAKDGSMSRALKNLYMFLKSIILGKEKLLQKNFPQITRRLSFFNKIVLWIPANYEKQSWKIKIPLLGIATLFLLLKLKSYYQKYIFPHIEPITSGSVPQYNKIQSLVFFDILVCIGMAFVVAVLVAMIFGKPDRPGRLLSVFRNHPLITLIVFTYLLNIFLLSAPKTLADIFVDFAFETGSIFNLEGVHPLYKQAANISALCIGLSVADIAFRPGTARFWVYPILLAPQYPLLWWNALSWLFPSRYWWIWRPVLAVASCITLLLVFPSAQPIRDDTKDEWCKPAITKPAKQELPCSCCHLLQ